MKWSKVESSLITLYFILQGKQQNMKYDQTCVQSWVWLCHSLRSWAFPASSRTGAYSLLCTRDTRETGPPQTAEMHTNITQNKPNLINILMQHYNSITNPRDTYILFLLVWHRGLFSHVVPCVSHAFLRKHRSDFSQLYTQYSLME